YTVFSLTDLAFVGSQAVNEDKIDFPLTLFLATAYDTYYTIVINDKQKFLDYWEYTKIVYNAVHGITTNLSDMKRLKKLQKSHESTWDKYFMGKNPLIKDNDQSDPAKDKMNLLNFFA